jgi:hypothetical protein
MARVKPYDYQNHSFTKMMWAVSHPLFINMACAHRLGCDEVFLFPFSILSHALEIYVSPFQKQLCSPVYNFIKFGFYFFNYYLFCFQRFLKLSFFSIFSLCILLHLIFIYNLFPLLLIALFLCFINFSWLTFFFQFFPRVCYSILLHLFFYPILILIFYYFFHIIFLIYLFFLSLNILFYFVFLSDFGSHSFNYIFFNHFLNLFCFPI